MKLQPTHVIAFVVILFSSSVIKAQDVDRTVESYRATARQIIRAARSQNDSYLKLQELCDDIGNRLSGSESLEKAIVWAQQSMKDDGQENVHAEPITVRKWVRGDERCDLVLPRPFEISMLGLGGSVGTPPDGITAETIVVRDKAALDSLADDEIEGKIVVFNFPMPQYSDATGSGYGKTVQYRGNGAIWAAERGAVAALIRSVTAYSLSTPHTGAMRYDANVKKIPTAAITVEAAMMLERFQKRNIPCVVRLAMQAEDQGEVLSANVVAEIVGSEKPEEIVLIGGHIDSWDVGQGAQDDGAGCVAAMEAINILRKLKLKPRRTIRVVLWTNEENGLAGARGYLARHQKETHVAAIESDSGGFKPQGISVDMEDDQKELIALGQLEKILDLLEPVGSTRATTGHSGADVGPLKILGTACMGLQVDGRLYFNTHHTAADTVDKVNPKQLTDCAITLAVAAYVLADMPQRIGEEVTSER